MKKIYLLGLAALSATTVSAQRSSVDGLNKFEPTFGKFQHKAAVDTLFMFDGNNFFGNPPAVDFANFDFLNEDVDALPLNSGIADNFSTTGGYTFYYEVDSVTGDSSFYMGAASWFEGLTGSAAQSDDWFTFGPINVPADGAKLYWSVRTPDNAFRDGYQVLVNTEALEVDNFVAAGDTIFRVADNAASSAGQTEFTQRSVSLTDYADSPIYIAFHHNAQDMFIIFFDDIFITNESGVGIRNNESFSNAVKVFPNPSNNGSITINYNLENSGNVSLEVFDVTGSKVLSSSFGQQSAGVHYKQVDISSLSAGVYSYSLKAANAFATKTFVVK